MIAVIGKGILGLSVAEFLSRQSDRKVVVLFSETQPPASAAAAANLATKSQVFARDPHFALKLQSKKMYPEWLSSLTRELQLSPLSSHTEMYRSGVGHDFFTSSHLADRQWVRVLQSPEELLSRGLPQQQLTRVAADRIEYGDEAWVDAEGLLEVLEKVCRQRGVFFHPADVSRQDAFLSWAEPFEAVILCAGSATLQILESWKVTSLPISMRKSLRWSYGGTLALALPKWQMPEGCALVELVSESALSKLTLSGHAKKVFCSSVSVACTSGPGTQFPSQPDPVQIKLQQESLLAQIEEFFGEQVEQKNCSWRWGMRLGFGHRELIVEALPHAFSFLRGPLIVAAGAHKSGFLFAPSIGSLVLQKMHSALNHADL